MDRFALRFRLAGIPVSVAPGFWLAVLLTGHSYGWRFFALWVPATLVFLLIHELAHAGAARIVGGAGQIRIGFFAGEHQPSLPLRSQRWVVSLAGPLASLLLAGAFLLAAHLWPPTEPWVVLASRIGWKFNVLFALVNLFPIQHFDGIRTLEEGLGHEQRFLAIVSTVLSFVLGVGAFVYGFTGFGVWFVLLACKTIGVASGGAVSAQFSLTPRPTPRRAAARRIEFGRTAESVRDTSRPAGATQARPLLPPRLPSPGARQDRPGSPAAIFLATALLHDSHRAFAQAAPYARCAFEAAPTDESAGLVVRALARSGGAAEAERIAHGFAWTQPSHRDAAWGEVHFSRGDFSKAAECYQASFERSGAASAAYDAARSSARAGEPARAAAWLDRAIKAGFEDFDLLANEPGLAPHVRH